MKDTVTIGLYSTENEDGTFNKALFSQKENVVKIQKKLIAASLAAKREPPVIVVSVLLVPNWKKQNSGYDNPEYIGIQRKFLDNTRAIFNAPGIEVQDFYHEARLTPAEKTYMHQLKTLGSNIDIIKVRAIINNQNVRHLQLDSNTQIYDFFELYRQTFEVHESEQKDGLNASYYSLHYVSAHNKIIYTTPNGKLASTLEAEYLKYCETHKDNLSDKEPEMNSIYGKAFTAATDIIGLTRPSKDPNDHWLFHPAIMNQPEYRISKNVVTIVKRSWSKNSKTHTEIALREALTMLPSVSIGDAICDFDSFKYLIKKYTENLWQHAIGHDLPSSELDIRTLNELLNDSRPHQQLLSISDQTLDMTIISKFYNRVLTEKTSLLTHVARVIPNTDAGNILSQKLFECGVSELYKNPLRRAKMVLVESLNIGILAPASRIDGYGKFFQINPSKTTNAMLDDLVGTENQNVSQNSDNNIYERSFQTYIRTKKECVDLICQSASGQLTIIQEMIASHCCDVNEVDRQGNAAILMAAARNDITMLEVLLNAGAEVDIENSYGLSPLAWAKFHQNDDMVQLINEAISKKTGICMS